MRSGWSLNEEKTMSKVEKIEIFVPAHALEHPANKETARREEKIRMAILRYYQQDDFMALLEAQDSIPWVNLHKVTFKPRELGYKVLASIEIGV